MRIIANRRSYFRLPYEMPFKFITNFDKKVASGLSLNVSQGGLLLRSRHIAPISSLIMLRTNLEVLDSFIDLKELLLLNDEKIIGKVVRLLYNKKDGFYFFGINFIKKIDIQREDVRKILNNMKLDAA